MREKGCFALSLCCKTWRIKNINRSMVNQYPAAKQFRTSSPLKTRPEAKGLPMGIVSYREVIPPSQKTTQIQDMNSFKHQYHTTKQMVMKTTNLITGRWASGLPKLGQIRHLIAFFFTLAFLGSSALLAQNETIEIESLDACPGQQVIVSVTGYNFHQPLGGFSAQYIFDTAVLTPLVTFDPMTGGYHNVINKNAGFSGFFLPNTVGNNTGIAWFGFGGFTDTGTVHLFDMIFTYKGGTGNIGFSSVPGSNTIAYGNAVDIIIIEQPGVVSETGRISTQPTDQNVNDGDPASFSLSAPNAIGFQWQVRNGSNWISLSNNAPYSGVTTNTLNISAATLAMNASEYRCLVTGPCVKNSFTSDTVVLNVSSSCNNAIANAGPNRSMCSSDASITFTASALDYDSVLWTTSGDGSIANAKTLTPTYTPGPNDLNGMTVTLTLTAYATAPCTNGTDQMNITIMPAVSGDAGSDESTCQGVPFNLNNSSTPPTASVFNGGILWTENGTGSLSQANSLTPTYNPGVGEFGYVTLTMTVFGVSPCPNVVDQMTLTITPGPQVDAGSNETICAGQSFNLGNSATPPSSGGLIDSLRWSHMGTGSLSGATTLTPTYTPGVGETGAVTLILTGYGGGCPEAYSLMTLTIVNAPTATLSGGATLCPGENTDLNIAFTGTAPWTFVYAINGTDQAPITTSANPYTLNVSPTTSTTYTLSSVEDAACPGTVSGSATVTNAGNPTVSISATANPICDGESTDLTASGASNYVWDNSLGSGAIHTVSPSANTTYSVTGTDGNGCTATANISITVNAVPVVGASAIETTICEGESTDLTATGAGSYAWSNGGSTATITVSPLTTTTYTVTGTTNGCTATASVEITVNPVPTVAITPDADTLCEGESTTLTASGADAYLWSTTETTASISVSPAATATYTVTGTTNACSASAQAEVVVNALPVANAGTDQNISTNASTTLSGSATGGSGNYSYSWSPAADLVDPNVQNPTTVNLSASTVFSLVVTDLTTSCVSAASTVTVFVTGAALSADATATPDVLCLGDTTWLNANAAGGSGLYTYSWTSNPAGFTSAIANPWAVPTVTTTYYVQVDDGVKTLVEDSVTVVVNNLPNVTINADTNTICKGDSLILTASGADDYEWNTGETTPSITVSPAVTATYSVTGSTLNGCIASATYLVTVNPLPNVEINALESAICEGASTDLTATGASSYAWSTADITPMITVSPTTNTLYSVTGTDAQGCSASADITITVNNLPVVDITATDAILCEGESTDLTASGADSYEWNTTETASTITVSPMATTSYQVTGTDVNGCQNTAEISITVNTLPSLTVNATEMEVCEGESSDLSVSGADTYEWSTTETTASITVTPLTTTTYQVTGTDINGCQNTAEITITVNALPVVIISASADSICEGDNSTLTASGADSYEWNTGELTAAISVNPATTTTYSLTATDLNGCIATGAIEVYVFDLPIVSLNATDMEICAGESTDITASGAATYAWSNGGNTASINVSPLATTIYTVSGTDANGCVQTANISITVNPLPVADAGIDQLIPFNSTTTLSGSASAGSGNYAYAWSPAASLADPSVQNPTTIALVNTTVFNLTVTDVTTQCVSAPASVTVNVSGAPLTLTISATPDIICSGENTQLQVVASGGSGSYTYSWTSNPAGFTSAIANPVVSPLVTTSYYVVVDDGSKALLSDSITVTVNDPATAYAGTDTTVCEGNDITIAGATASNAQGISWVHNGSGTLTGATTLSPTYQPAAGETGMITLSLTATSTAPCADVTDEMVITINPRPVITSNPIDATVVEPNPASFSVAATGATTYQWQVSTDGGLNWTDVVNDTLYSGANTANLQLATTNILMNGNEYQCIVSAQDCEVVSAAAQLNVSAQGATIVTTAGSAQACTGDTIIIPVNVENFINVASASLALQFDPAVLTFLNAQNLNPTMAGMNSFLVNASASSVLLSWFSVSPANIGNALLAEYVFVYHGGSSNLSWDLATSGNCEYTDLLSNVLPATFINGAVSAASSAPLISAQPVDANILDGGNASFMLTASGADTYQWQVRIGGGSWNNLSDNTLYSGSNTATLSLTGATLLENFYEFRCIVGETTCGLTSISDAATLYVSPAGPVLTSIGNADACPGDVILVPVNVADMSTVASISLTLGYNPAVLTYMSIQNLNPVLSASAPLINASSGNFFFSWFSIVPANLTSGKLFDIEFTYHGGSTALSWDTLTAGNCEFTDFNALLLPAQFTDGVVNQLSFAPVVSTPPADAAVVDGDTAYFSVAATGADAYQWEISTNGGATWTVLTDNAVYQGSTTANLQVNGANLLMNFHLFRCVLTENVCNLAATSTAGELTVSPSGPVVTTAGNVDGCPGDMISVPVNVENMSTVSSISLTLGFDPAVLSYSGITNVNAQLATGSVLANATAGSFAFSWFSLTPAYISDDILFEINFTYLGGYTDLSWDIVTTGACEYNDVNALTLPANYVDGSVDAASTAPVVSLQPADISVNTQDPASFTVTATGADAYQWQMSSNGGLTWMNLVDGADYSGTTTNSLTVTTATLQMTGREFRCILTENLCGLEQISDAATLTVNAIPATTSAGSALACVGDTVVIPVNVVDLYDVATVSLTIDFDPLVLNYLYSQNIDPALTGAPLINASAGSVKFSWFSLVPANVGSTTLFELVFIYQGGSTNLSWDLTTPGNTEYGDINTNLIPSSYNNGSVGFAGVAAVITNQPLDVTSYVGFTAAFDVSASGATAYQWQVSTDGGVSWTDLADNAMYAGTTTPNLQVSGLTLAMDAYQYHCIVSGTCDVTTTSDAATLTVMAQPPIITILGDVAECQGNLVVPVIAEEFNNVAVISLGLNFDPALMQYVGYQNVHPALGGAFFMINASGNNLFVSWFAFAPANIGNDTLFELVFNGIAAGNAPITWNTATPGVCQYTDPSSNILLANFVNGNVSVYPNPTPVISGTQSICEGGSATYSVPANAGHSYQWSVAGGQITSGQNSAQVTVAWGAAGSGQLTVFETIDSTGCFAQSNAYNVTINTLPTPMIAGPDSLCEGESGQVYSTSLNAGSAYLWSINGGTIVSGQNTHSVIVDWGAAGTGSLTVTETVTATNCTADASFTVVLSPLPTPMISGSDSVCAFDANVVYSTQNVAGHTYSWTISGGTIISGQQTANVSVDWGASGSGTLEVTQTDAATGCQQSASFPVVINALPEPVISGTDSVCENEAGIVYATPALAGHSYQWNVLGGSISSGQGTASITVDWGLAGTGTVEVTETVDATNCSASASYSVTINVLPAPVISGIDTVCEFYTGAVYTVTANAGSAFTWTVNGGVITSGQNSAQITVDWNTAGTGTVGVIETTQNGCQASGSLDVTINFQPAPSITGSTMVCAFEAGILYTTPHSAGNIYTWNVSGGSIVQGAATNAIVVDWGAAGTGTVDLNVTTDEGCTADAPTLTVTIEALPTVYNVTGGGSFCAGTTGINIGLDSSEVGVDYTLVRDGSLTTTMLSGTGNALDFGPQTLGGVYAIYAENASSSCGIMMNGTATVTVIPVPSIITQPANVSVDEGSDAIFTLVAANATGYQWQISLNNGSTWNNLGNGASFSGVTTDSLIVHNADLSMTGQRFRVIVSGQCTPNATSNAALLTVNPVITTYLGNVTACAGSFSVPVNVEHFIGVASISLTINIDTSLLTFTGYQNLNPALSSGFPLINLLGDQIKFSYFSIFPATIGDGLLLELNFTSNGGYSVLSFDTQIAGNCEYNQLSGAAYTGIFVNGSADILPLPMAFNVTGGGSYCDGGSGIAVGLDGSETGKEYILYLDGVATSQILAGTGNALNFGMQTTGGIYTVYAMDTALGCAEWMNGQAVVDVLAAPAVFNVTGGGTLCAGDAGFNIGLDGSETGVSYTLFVDGIASGQVLSGTGSALDFGVFDVAGTYTISAVNDTTQCFADMAGNALIVVNALPLTFNVTGGGSFCDNGLGVDVGLDGSETGIAYTLYIDGVATTQVLTGTGNALSFGLQNITGVYTVMAENSITACSQMMAGSAVVNLYPNPMVFNVSGGGTLCDGQAGFPVLLDSSETNVTYTLYLNGNATAQSLAGTGSSLDFGNQTQAGTYTVMAVDNTNGCSLMMNGSADIVVNPLPIAFNVVGGGPYCDGSNGAIVGLDGSENGIEYTLYLDGNPTGMSVIGTGNAVDFGLQMTVGTYTVMALNTTTACENAMNGATNVSVSPLPSANAGGFVIICEGENTVLNASVSGGTAPYTYAWSPAAGLDNPVALNPTASPTATTYYTLVVTDSIGCTAVDTAIVVVNPSPAVDAGLDKTIMSGTATFLNGSVSGGVMPYTIAWTPGASLNDPTSLVPIASPLVTTTYTLLVTDANGCYGEDQVTITVNPTPPGYNLFGQVTYDNSVMTPLNDVDVYLEDGATLFDTTLTDPLGNYLFPGLTDGAYTTTATTQKAFGGVNALDALLIAQQFQGTANLTGLRLAAADLDGNMVPNANDALLALQRAAGIISAYPIMQDWLFEEANVTISGGDIFNPFQGICFGDVNGSYVPGLKTEGNTPLAENGSLNLISGQTIRIPVYAANTLEAAALSLQFTMPSGLTVVGAEMATNAATYVFNADQGLNKLEWYKLESQVWNEGDVVVYLLVKVDNAYTGDAILLENSSVAGDVHSNVLGTPALTAPKLVLAQSAGDFSLSNNYPNPFSDYTEIVYHLPQAAQVSLGIFNMLGEQVMLVTNGMQEAGEYQVRVDAGQLAPGTYFYRLVANTSGQTFSQTRKMVVTR